MKAPKNFYNTVDQRKLGLEDGLLPDVTAADNGKILGVTGGKWQPVSGAGTEVVTAAITYAEGEYSCDKTHAEIAAAIAGGSIVLATYDGRTYVYAGSGTEAAGSPVYFSYLQADSESQMIGKVFEIDEDERIVYSEHDIAEELPIVTSADNGKLLIVDEGIWKSAPLPPKAGNNDVINMVTISNGKIVYVIPRIQINANTRFTVDNDGYYNCDVYMTVITNFVNGYTSSVKPEDFDNIYICGATSLFVNLKLNDGIEDINLRGSSGWLNAKLNSTGYATSIVYAFDSTFFTSSAHFEEVFKAYDTTISYDSTNNIWKLKFKLEKLSTT